MLVEQEKLRINASLNRKLTQESHAKTVNGSDHSAVQRALVIQPMPSLIWRDGLQNEIELFPESLAHLVGRAIGKGDGDDLIDVEFVFAQDVQVTLDQDRCLSGTRPCRH